MSRWAQAGRCAPNTIYFLLQGTSCGCEIEIEGINGVDAAVIMGIVECRYAIVEGSVDVEECFRCIVDLERDIMHPWKATAG